MANPKNKTELLNRIKKGEVFDNEILKSFGISCHIRDKKCENQVCEHKSNDNKVYEKDTITLKRLLSELHTIEKNNCRGFDTED